jgi:hypothetical protein
VSGLEIRAEDSGLYHLYLNDEEVRGVNLVSVEFDARNRPMVQLEISPIGEQLHLNLLNPTISWIVGCPNCPHNSTHTCEVNAAGGS